MTPRTIALLSILSIAALAWLGCGVDEEPMRPRVTQPQGSEPDLAKMSLDERKQATRYQDELGPKFFVWPGGSAGEHDAVADTRECREEAVERDDYVRANGMVRFAIIADCMKARGWTVDQGAIDDVVASQ